MKSGEILLEVVRNEMVESVHSGHLLILDGAGREVLSLGDPDEIIYRSEEHTSELQSH